MFLENNVDLIVSGGQTMNPSTADFVEAIKKLNAEHVFLFPNNGNIVMAAKQAAELMKEECDATVIETKTIPEGLVACLLFNPDDDVESNIESMKENIANVKSGEITYAIKDTTIDDVKVEKGKFMGIARKKILCCHKHKINTLVDLLEALVDEESSLITILCGQDVTEKEKEEVQERITKKFDSCEVYVEDGGQPVYSFFVSVE